MAKQKYRAVAKFRQHAAGDVFEATLDPDLERRALARGQIKKVATTKQKEGKADG